MLGYVPFISTNELVLYHAIRFRSGYIETYDY